MEDENNLKTEDSKKDESGFSLIGSGGVVHEYSEHGHRRHHSHKRSSKSSQEKHKSTVKHKSLGQRIAWKLLPLLLFFAGVACVSYFGIQKGLINSPVMAMLISEASTEGGSGLDTSLDTVSISTSDGKLDSSKFPKIRWGDMWATLSIPSQNIVDKPVYLGDKGDILDKMVIGTYFGSTYPGQNGKTVLDGHVGSTFWCLEDLKEGDRIILKTLYGDYEYEVREIVIFTPDDVDMVIQQKEDYKEDSLFCYTCYPRNAAYRSKRIGVKCIKVSGIPWSEE